jgi:predicted HAD superfamily phosphohydrolase
MTKQRVLSQTIQSIDELQKNLDDFEKVASRMEIRKLYHKLRTAGAGRTATHLMIHTENLLRELREFEETIKDGRDILLQHLDQAKRNEK